MVVLTELCSLNYHDHYFGELNGSVCDRERVNSLNVSIIKMKGHECEQQKRRSLHFSYC